jgi:hypothetical protein
VSPRGRFQVYEHEGEYRVRLDTAQGTTVLHCAPQPSPERGMDLVEQIKDASLHRDAFHKHSNADGFYFTIHAKDDTVLASSPSYTTNIQRDVALMDVRWLAIEAPVVLRRGR